MIQMVLVKYLTIGCCLILLHQPRMFWKTPNQRIRLWGLYGVATNCHIIAVLPKSVHDYLFKLCALDKEGDLTRDR